MSDVLAMSLNGQLRIRELRSGTRGVVELHDGRGGWVWCVWTSCDIEQAWSLFHNQCKFHTGQHPWIEAYEMALAFIIDLQIEPTSALREVGHEVLGLPWGEQLGEFVIYGTRRIEHG